LGEVDGRMVMCNSYFFSENVFYSDQHINLYSVCPVFSEGAQPRELAPL
jgi:hypothetical protein